MHISGTRTSSCLLAVGLALGFTVTAAPTASARILGSGSENFSGSNDFVECGVHLQVAYAGTDAWVDKLRGGDVASFDYLTAWFTSSRGQLTQTITNLDTGRMFSAETHSTSWDQKVLSQSGTVSSSGASRAATSP